MHWASLREKTNLSGMHILLTVYRLGGRTPFRCLLYPVLAWYLCFAQVARAASLEYLARLYAQSGGRTPAPGLWQSYRHFIAFAEVMLDRLVYDDSAAVEQVRCDLQGEEHIRRVVESGRGAILLTAHMGNLELCRMLARARGDIRINVLVYQENSQRFNQMLHQQNPETALNLIPVAAITPQLAMQLAERVEQGELIVITGDRIPVDNEKETLRVNFLGQPARLPLGPYILASLFRCPLLSMLCTQRGEVYHINVTWLADQLHLPRARRSEAALPLAQAYAALLEAECLAAPLQWFNFFPFWAGGKDDKFKVNKNSEL